MNTTIPPICRFVIRPLADPSFGGDLVLGAMFRRSKILHPNVVYQVENVVGEPTIRAMGPSSFQAADRRTGFHWKSSVSDILDHARNRHLMTIDEFKLRAASR